MSASTHSNACCHNGRRTRRRPRDSAFGYTAVEVLMAIVLLSIGAGAVMTMQKASVQGNLDARKADIANSIARTWIDRFQRDGMAWTVGNSTTPTTSLARATMLSTLVNNGGAWGLATPIPTSITTTALSPCYDILGRELDQPTISLNPSPVQFCVHARATYLSPLNDLLRIDVRVIWLRGIFSLSQTGAPTAITDTGLAASANLNPATYRTIYATTAVKESPAQ